MTHPTFQALGLAEPILRALAARGYETPTPIQAAAIPPLMEGRDLVGLAETGSGKTAAFALPILHGLAAHRPAAGAKGPFALILAPTRELAIQIADEVKRNAIHLRLTQAVIFGGVGHGPQTKALSRGVDIVVATPGRLLDHMREGVVSLGAVRWLVLDEADRMLDMGFLPDVKRIIAATPRARQTSLFSATMEGEVAKLAAQFLREPARVEMARSGTPVERIEQSVRHLAGDGKNAALLDLFVDRAVSRAIIFTRTKHRANKVTEELVRAGVDADAIHGDKSQGARQRALQRFSTGKSRALVATDIAARGIDVTGITHVVNYDLPGEPESYVHRIGRTARNGAGGIAVAFCDPSERAWLRAIERLTGMRIPVVGDGPVGPEEAPPVPGRNRQNNAGPARPRQPAKPARAAAPHEDRSRWKSGRKPARRSGG